MQNDDCFKYSPPIPDPSGTSQAPAGDLVFLYLFTLFLFLVINFSYPFYGD
jgi:hypothetical protein